MAWEDKMHCDVRSEDEGENEEGEELFTTLDILHSMSNLLSTPL